MRISINVFDPQFSLENEALEVYLAGCNQRCPGCHNPETWDFEAGKPYNAKWLHRVRTLVKNNPRIVHNLWVLGGEPLDQNHEDLCNLLKLLRGFGVPLWLFTSYELAQVPSCIKFCCSYIKTGKYLKDFPTSPNYREFGVHLATTNQHIHKKGEHYV